jgi:protein involved in polysaccharide export with SLBB domain
MTMRNTLQRFEQFQQFQQFQRFLAALSVAALAATASGQATRKQSSNAQSSNAQISSGPLRTGDRILLSVEGEPTLTDTFTVRPGPEIDLPSYGAIRLDGVRRDNLQENMTLKLARYIKNPVVHARALVRVAVLGEVARPGFYSVPTDAMFSDVINAAGGPTHDADMKKLHVDRVGVVIAEGKPLQRALASGATLAQRDVESGDEIIVPLAHDAESRMRMISLFVGIPLAVATVLLLVRR